MEKQKKQINELPAKAQLQRRVVRLIIICAVLLILNNQLTPDLNWGLWITAGLGFSLILDIIDYIFIKRNTKTYDNGEK